MLRMIAVIIAITGLPALVDAAPAPAKERCTSLQARCAIEAGGSCNTATGRWRYRCISGACTARFNECVSRGLPRQS
jgi:hypothetical protein